MDEDEVDIEALVAEALAQQVVEAASEFTEANPALRRLVEDVPADRLLPLVERLRVGDVEARRLAARLLTSPAIVPAEKLRLAREAIVAEERGEVLNWLVLALGWSGLAEALPDAIAMADHPEVLARVAVPDALSACAADLAAIEPVLLGLLSDEDWNVRWSAAFELGEWAVWQRATHLRDRLAEVAEEDPASDVRTVAARAVEEFDEGSAAAALEWFEAQGSGHRVRIGIRADDHYPHPQFGRFDLEIDGTSLGDGQAAVLWPALAGLGLRLASDARFDPRGQAMGDLVRFLCSDDAITELARVSPGEFVDQSFLLAYRYEDDAVFLFAPTQEPAVDEIRLATVPWAAFEQARSTASNFVRDEA